MEAVSLHRSHFDIDSPLRRSLSVEFSPTVDDALELVEYLPVGAPRGATSVTSRTSPKTVQISMQYLRIGGGKLVEILCRMVGG